MNHNGQSHFDMRSSAESQSLQGRPYVAVNLSCHISFVQLVPVDLKPGDAVHSLTRTM